MLSTTEDGSPPNNKKFCECGCGRVVKNKYFHGHNRRTRPIPTEEKIFCGCGCGKTLPKYDSQGRERKFIENHHMKGFKHSKESLLKMSQSLKGKLSREKHPFWKGTKILVSGYVMINVGKENHPYASKDGYVFEHRLVMEQHLGRYLTKEEQIHHKNKITNDNRIENLLLISSNSNHMKLHRQEYTQNITLKRNCVLCKSNKTYYDKKQNHYQWYFLDSNKNKSICSICYERRKRLLHKK